MSGVREPERPLLCSTAPWLGAPLQQEGKTPPRAYGNTVSCLLLHLGGSWCLLPQGSSWASWSEALLMSNETLSSAGSSNSPQRRVQELFQNLAHLPGLRYVPSLLHVEHLLGELWGPKTE